MRASEKRIIYVKDTGSKLFEEAYFVLRRGVLDGTAPSEDDIVREASRIVQEGSFPYPASARKARRSRSWMLFLSGGAAAAAIFGSFAWVIAWL